jgi:phage pi2 protein 07
LRIVEGYVFYPSTAGMKGSFSAGTLTTFRKSLSANRVAPTNYYKESRL